MKFDAFIVPDWPRELKLITTTITKQNLTPLLLPHHYILTTKDEFS